MGVVMNKNIKARYQLLTETLSAPEEDRLTKTSKLKAFYVIEIAYLADSILNKRFKLLIKQNEKY